MDSLLDSIGNMRNSGVGREIGRRMKEFEAMRKASGKDLFNELCFCLLTANFNAERSIRIQDEVGDGFLTLRKDSLAKELVRLGHRFPNARAGYIVEARRHRDSLKDFKDERAFREWLVANVKGLGYKESSHFLRNIGFKGSAIIDFHIIDLLVRNRIIKRPKSLTKSDYLHIEGILSNIAKKAGLNLAELDLYLWYIETGKVLK